jgi:primosomal protein N'
VRGWVVETSPNREGKLKEVVGVSGAVAVFDHSLLKTLSWAAHHYVAPVSVLLNKATPPNLPKPIPVANTSDLGLQPQDHPIFELAVATAAGERRPSRAVLGRWQSLDWLDSLAPIVELRRSAMVIAASAAEVDRICQRARPIYGEALVEVASMKDAEVTRGWELAQSSGRIVVGTPRVATWMVRGLSLLVILEEGRRAMKDRQTPTVHVREVVRKRSLIEGCSVAFFGPTPSVEVLSAGAEVTRVGNRAWPLVEIVDRSDEAPGSGQLSGRVVAAIRAMVDAKSRTFVFASLRMTEQIVREINARLGAPLAGTASSSSPVTVGTERDLAGLSAVSLTVATNVDGMLMGPGYRTEEEALRQLARLANSLESGPGHRMMVQTFDVASPLVQALRKGDPIPYLEQVLVDRAKTGVPPSTDMIAVEVRGELPDGLDLDLRELPNAVVIGPIEIEEGRRWLLEGDLGKARPALRQLARKWRDSGGTVRIDADPIDF